VCVPACNHAYSHKVALLMRIAIHWLANIEKLKLINKTTVAVHHFLSTLIKAVLKMSIILSSITPSPTVI